MFLYFRRFFCLIRFGKPAEDNDVSALFVLCFHTENVWFRFGRHKKSKAVERKIVGRFRDFCICQTV